jgi:hypothetical protein
MFKVTYKPKSITETSPNNFSPCKFCCCVSPYPPPCLPTPPSRTAPASYRKMLFITWRPSGYWYYCKLCCRSCGYIQLRAWNTVDNKTPTYYVPKLPQSTSRNKRWRHSLGFCSRYTWVAHYCDDINGTRTLLRRYVQQWLVVQREAEIHIRDDYLGCSRKSPR